MFLGPDEQKPIDLNLVDLVVNASLPVQIVVGILLTAALTVWIIATLKFLQLGRSHRAETRFETDAALAQSADEMFDIAAAHVAAPGARVVLALAKRRSQPKTLAGVAKRAIVAEQVRASLLMSTLSSIAAAAPFVGLFGTVWGIMDAFLRIGREKSASLPVVAPAIGEALFATLIGLVAAIPAVVMFNAINKRVDDLMSSVEASAEGWIALAGHGGDTRQTHALPVSRRPDRPSRGPNE